MSFMLGEYNVKNTGRFHIAIPGPTNIPERILNAMHISSEDQRNPRNSQSNHTTL